MKNWNTVRIFSPPYLFNPLSYFSSLPTCQHPPPLCRLNALPPCHNLRLLTLPPHFLKFKNKNGVCICSNRTTRLQFVKVVGQVGWWCISVPMWRRNEGLFEAKNIRKEVTVFSIEKIIQEIESLNHFMAMCLMNMHENRDI